MSLIAVVGSLVLLQYDLALASLSQALRLVLLNLLWRLHVIRLVALRQWFLDLGRKTEEGAWQLIHIAWPEEI